MTSTHAARKRKAHPVCNGQPKSVETKGRPLNQSNVKKSINRPTKDHPPFRRHKKEQFMNKNIVRNKKAILSAALIIAATASAFAQGNGIAGINEATSMVSSYFDPGTKLIYAIGAVVGLIGGVKVYGKFVRREVA
jgi:hypothetical protein